MAKSASSRENLLLILPAALFRMFTDPEIATHALQNIQHQPMRRNLTLLGIIIGIAAITTLSALGQGLNSTIQVQFESLGLNSVYIQPGSEFGSASALFSRIPESDLALIEKVPHVTQVIPFYESAGIAVRGNEEASFFIIGIEPDDIPYLEQSGYLSLSRGRHLRENDLTALMVYENFFTEAFEQELDLRQNVTINGRKYRIVGASKQSDSAFSGFGIMNVVYASKRTLQQHFGETNPTELVVLVDDRENVPSTVARIERVLEREHGEKNFTVTSSENLLESVLGVLGVVQFFVVAIAGIAILVGGIGIMNTMFMAVSERTREIGTMKALGAVNPLIRALFLAEAGVIGAVGGLIGIVFGYLMAYGVGEIATQSGFGLPIAPDAGTIIFALAFSIIIGVGAGIAPAEKAIRLDPVEAIRYQ